MAQIAFKEKTIFDREGNSIVVISADSIKRAFKKVKEDVNQLRSEIVENKQILANQAEIIKQLLDRLEDIVRIKNKIGELEAIIESRKNQLDNETKKLLVVMSDKINYLYEKMNKLEEESILKSLIKQRTIILSRFITT